MDIRSPLVLSTRDLGRGPGSLREHLLEVPAPEAMGIEVIGVPTGSDVELDLRLEAVSDGVLVTGHASAQLVGECSRCLAPIEDTLHAPFQELFFYPSVREALAREEDPDEAEDRHALEGDLIDLEPVLRDAVVLALPFQPRCSAECAGLCPVCGARLAEAGEDHAHEAIDPRWNALVAMLEQPTPDQGAAGEGIEPDPS